MEILSLNGTVLKSLPLQYAHDADVKIKGFTENFSSGIVFSFSPALQDVEDFTTNNYNNLILTDKKVVSNFVELTGKAPAYPQYFPTHMKVRDNFYWEVDTLNAPVSSTISVKQYTDPKKLAQNNCFEVIFVNGLDCVIRTYSNNIIKYLTYNKDTQEYTFETSPDIQGELGTYSTRLVDQLSLSASGVSEMLDFTASTNTGTITRTFSYVYDLSLIHI